MNPKKIKAFILDGNRDLHERLFVLSMIIMLVVWLLTLAEISLLGCAVPEILLLAGAILATAGVTVLSVRMGHYRIGALLISIGITFAFLPITFFGGGGIYGDAPLWFLFSILFICVSLSGKVKLVMLLLNGVTTVACWCISYLYPETIIENTRFSAHLYSLFALLMMATAVGILVSFQNRIYAKEVLRSQEQKQEIQQLGEAQNRFFSSMSHEIRTPINTIIGLNEMILREDISDEVAEDAQNIQSAGKMLLHLINDILDMSKLSSGKMELSYAPYHPGNMLSELVGMLWLRAKEKQLEFHVNVSPEIPAELIGDEMRIKQILVNVLNNAIKYTKEGSVTLSLQRGETADGMTNIIYTVTDTGIGIKKESIPYLFTAFRRGDEEQNRYIEGTGLGLSIVKELVDLMGGKITVNSVYTKGSTFIIEIPQRAVADDPIGEVHIERRKAEAFKQKHRVLYEAPEARVLVVDDNASNLLVTEKLLRETKVQTDTVSSGAEALKKTLNTHYHVIFMDHLMPEMDGIECLRAIRAQVGGLCKDSKVVALTANAGEENRTIYKKEGFDGHLVKPISGDLLEKELYCLLPKELTIVTGEEEEILKETISWMNATQQRKAVAITTESVADLPEELLKENGIAVIPHMVCTEEGNFKDGIEIETSGLLHYMEDEECKVSVEGAGVAELESFFAKQLAAANNVIHISISSKLANSGCLAAKEAAKAFDNVTVIDTGQLSSGQGLVVLDACRYAAMGMSPKEIAEALENSKDLVRSSFIVDNLDFLARAGQVSRKIADLTRAIMARPVLVMKNGKLGVKKVYFGTRERAWVNYIKDVLRYPHTIDPERLVITYVGLNSREREWIRTEVEKHMHFEQVYYYQASPVIAVNCGSGSFALFVKTMEKSA
ncbi:MAG: DegV family EDD domain-containing protein [Lachnospiraceae bacterium]|nr:DegV family EDD domain-containing protein [Lachnospiraceae bacterium]